MHVRTFGISVKATNAVTLTELFESMKNRSGQSDSSKSNLRRIFLDIQSHPEFFDGLVATIKDQKTFCELEDKDGNITIKVENLEASKKLMEHNFFIVNKVTGRGLYQHYHHSCSPGVFGSYLANSYSALCKARMENELTSLEATGQSTSNKRRAVKTRYSNRLSFSLIVHKESLAQVLSKFKEIKAFEYQFSEVLPENVKGVALSPYVRAVS